MKKNKQKTYTTKQVIDKLKKSLKKKRPVVNKYLKKHLKSIVNEELGKPYRSDAMKLLLKANKEEIGDFLLTYYSDGTGVGLIGSALDFIKDRLVRDGEVKKTFAKSFGLEEKLK
jgi:hypothetical protein